MIKIPAIKGFDEQAFQKYFKNTGWLMFGKLLSLIVGLIIARYLGPTGFGDLNFILALVAIMAAVGALGLDTFIIRELINEPDKQNEILGTSLGLRVIVNALLIPITVAFYLFFYDQVEVKATPLTLLVVLLSGASFFKSFNVIDAYFQSQVKSKYVVHVQNTVLLIAAALKIIVVSLGLSLFWIVLVLFIEGFILAIGLIAIYQKKGGNIYNWTFSWERGKGLLAKSFPLILSAVMVSIYMKIDQVMLMTVGREAVGIYSAAANLSEAWYFIPVAIVTSVFPAIIHARKTDLPRYKKRLGNLYDLLVLISLPVALFISFFAEDITMLVYGDKFPGVGIILSIHIWSGVFVFLGSASSQYLIAEGYTSISFYRTATGALVNVVLNLWLIPLYGGVGASIATLVACAVTTFYLLILSKTREQGIMMLKSLFLISSIQKLKRH